MTDLGFYRAKLKLYGGIPLIKALEYYESIEQYSECHLISRAIDEFNRKRAPKSIKLPKRMSEEIIDIALEHRQKTEAHTTLSDLLENIDEHFEKIIMEVAKENGTQSLN